MPFNIKEPKSKKNDDKKFEYLLIVQLKENFKLKRIIQLNWEIFVKYKKWHSTMNAWNILITKKLLCDADTLYEDI